MVCSNPPKPGPRNLAKKKSCLPNPMGETIHLKKIQRDGNPPENLPGEMFVLVCPHLHVASHIAKVTAIALLFLRPHALVITEACHFGWSPQAFSDKPRAENYTPYSLKLTYPVKMVDSNRNFLFQGSIFRGYVRFREGTTRILPREQFGRTKRGLQWSSLLFVGEFSWKIPTIWVSTQKIGVGPQNGW